MKNIDKNRIIQKNKRKLVLTDSDVFVTKNNNEKIYVTIISNYVGVITRRFKVKNKELYLQKMIKKYGKPTDGGVSIPQKSRKEINDGVVGRQNRIKRYEKMIEHPELTEKEIEMKMRMLTNSIKEIKHYNEQIIKETNKTELRVLKDSLRYLTNIVIPHLKWEIKHKKIHPEVLEWRKNDIQRLKKELANIYINYEEKFFAWKDKDSKYKLSIAFYHTSEGFFLPEGITENTVELSIYDPYILTWGWRRKNKNIIKKK